MILHQNIKSRRHAQKKSQVLKYRGPQGSVLGPSLFSNICEKKVYNLPWNYTIPCHYQYFNGRHYADDGDNVKDISSIGGLLRKKWCLT